MATQQDDSNDTAPVFSDAQMEALKELVRSTSNVAVTSQLKRHMEQFQKANAEQLAGITAAIEGLQQQRQPQQGEGDKSQSQSQSQGQDMVVKQLQTELATVKKELELRSQREQEAHKRVQMTELRTQAANALRNGGVNDKYHPALMALWESQNKMRFNENGEAVFARSEDEIMPLGQAVAEFLKTDDGKMYVSPVTTKAPVAPPGHASPGRPGEQRQQPTLDDLGRMLMR